ncbi:MAG TPA: YggS family pyridoxal phosphate-dependent enzyme [Bacteroidia bacterium]|nr:YggS family pyridoxal phosphate-dependent enzyme [Bacteroidia bacterium]
MSAKENLIRIKKKLPASVQLIAVSKTYPVSTILETYNAGHNVYGENKVQELTEKYYALPKDIQWHLIGHLQSNKVKYIAPFVTLIHSVDSIKLLEEIDKQAKKNHRVINCLLQIYIAKEETKFGLSFEEAEALLTSDAFNKFTNCNVIGLMGMATNTENQEQIRNEFRSLKNFFDRLKKKHNKISILSMGMSSDYMIAIEEGSTMIRVGSTIFGNRS